MTFDPSSPGTLQPQTPPLPAPGTPAPFAPTQPEPSPYAPFAGAPVSTVPVAPASKRKGSGGWLNVVLVIAAVVAVGGVAFALGRSTAPASTAVAGRNGVAGGGQFPVGSGGPGFGGGQNGGGFGGGQNGGGLGRGSGGGVTVSGTVESISGDTITVKTQSGQTVQFKLGSSTTYGTKQPATVGDIKTGSKVEVGLTFAGGQGPRASGQPGAGQPGGVVGTAGSVTVVP